MGFWILAILTGGASVAMLAAALLSRRDGRADGRMDEASDIEVYKAQLADLARDAERGVIGAEEAERARIEIGRRLLEADRRAGSAHLPGDSPRWANALALVASAALLLGGGALAYTRLGAPGYADLPLTERLSAANSLRENRPSQEEAEADMPVWSGPPEGTDPEYIELVTELRAAMRERPGELQGQYLLATHESALGNYIPAYQAMAKVIEIKGETATDRDYAQYADLMILAAGGYVSPEAERLLTRAMARNPANPQARYYSGLLFAQTARPDLAFRIWRDLWESSEPDDPWVVPLRKDLPLVANLAGVEYSLPELVRLPDAADILAAEDLTQDQRLAAIAAMASQLMDRLAQRGGEASEWARLINALGILGEQERAGAIYGEARTVFALRPQDLALIDQAARSVHVRLPEDPVRGPDAATVEAARDLSEAERNAMISSMIDGLEAELMAEGGSVDRWAMLLTSLAKTGDTARAQAALDAAVAQFAEDGAALIVLNRAAASVGLEVTP